MEEQQRPNKDSASLPLVTRSARQPSTCFLSYNCARTVPVALRSATTALRSAPTTQSATALCATSVFSTWQEAVMTVKMTTWLSHRDLTGAQLAQAEEEASKRSQSSVTERLERSRAGKSSIRWPGSRTRTFKTKKKITKASSIRLRSKCNGLSRLT